MTVSLLGPGRGRAGRSARGNTARLSRVANVPPHRRAGRADLSRWSRARSRMHKLRNRVMRSAPGAAWPASGACPPSAGWDRTGCRRRAARSASSRWHAGRLLFRSAGCRCRSAGSPGRRLLGRRLRRGRSTRCVRRSCRAGSAQRLAVVANARDRAANDSNAQELRAPVFSTYAPKPSSPTRVGLTRRRQSGCRRCARRPDRPEQ